MSRVASPYIGPDADVLTTTEKTPVGTTGAMAFDDITAMPTVAADAHFTIAGLHSSGPQNAAPDTLFIGADLGGDDGLGLFRVAFWNPKAAMWTLTTAYTALGAAELAGGTNALDGNSYLPACPRGATLGYIMVIAPFPAGGTFNIFAARDHR